MTKLNEVYRCNICGNIVEVLHAGGGELVCCGQPMELLEEHTEDAGYEKHVPVIEYPDQVRADEFFAVKATLGKAVAHPNTTEHHIRWIQ